MYRFLKRIYRSVHAVPFSTTIQPVLQRRRRKRPDVPQIEVPGENVLSLNTNGIDAAVIPQEIMVLMKRMRGAGYTAYLVGGTVRDLILKRKPKDFDIVVDTTPRKVKRLFWGCMIVGKRCPVALMRVGDEDVEISSFHSFGEQALKRSPASLKMKTDALEHALRHSNSTCSANFIRKYLRENFEGLDDSLSQKATYLALLRLADAQTRDFSINALLFDPLSGFLYDSVGGLEDIRNGIVRTILPPLESFHFDPARVLRAVRVSARCGFALDDATAQAAKAFSPKLIGLNSLPGGRRAMELHALMAHGSSGDSIRLAQKLGLVCAVVPTLSSILCHTMQGDCPCGSFTQATSNLDFNKEEASKRQTLLFALLEAMDKIAEPSQPVPAASWALLMAVSNAGTSDMSAFYSGCLESIRMLVKERSIARNTAKTARSTLNNLVETKQCQSTVSSFLKGINNSDQIRDFVREVIDSTRSMEKGLKKLGWRF